MRPLALLLVLSLGLAACGPTPTPPTPIPTSTATPVPPTATPRPSSTPLPTATPQTTRVHTDAAILLDRLDTLAVSLAWSLDGRYLYVGTETRGLITYDVQTRARLTVSGEGHIESLAMSPNGQVLAAAIGTDGSIRLLDTGIGEVILTLFPTHASAIKGLVFSPDNSLLASSGDDGQVFVWDVSTGDKLHSLVTEGEAAWGLAFSPDGSLLVAGTVRGHEVRVWDTATWTLRLAFEADQAVDLAFSPDSQSIVTAGGGQNEANIWNVNTGERLFNLAGTTGWVWAVDYAPGGGMVASGGNNEVITLWDTATGLPSREFYTGKHFTQALAFSPDGTQLASVSDEIWVWNTR